MGLLLSAKWLARLSGPGLIAVFVPAADEFRPKPKIKLKAFKTSGLEISNASCPGRGENSVHFLTTQLPLITHLRSMDLRT